MAQNLTYTRCGDYLISDIQLSHISDKPIGKYGRMRRAFALRFPLSVNSLRAWDYPKIAMCPDSGCACYYLKSQYP